MREILFRGKRKSDGEWLYGDLVAGLFFSRADKSPLTYILDPDIEEDYDCLGDFDDIDCEVIPKTVGQFTGLTDKNGKKIFEGDKIKLTQGIGTVEWSKTQSRFMIWLPKSNKFASFLAGIEYEVIGNIHDNPELLEEKK